MPLLLLAHCSEGLRLFSISGAKAAEAHSEEVQKKIDAVLQGGPGCCLASEHVSRVCQGKHKMHELYLQYLACRADWSKSVLTITAKKEYENKEVELYEFWTFNKMVSELGEDLAEDLKQRHIDAESKLPEGKKGLFIRKTLICTQAWSETFMLAQES